MDDNQKSVIYGELLNHHTRLHNKINEIKGSNIDLTQAQINEIRQLEQVQLKIVQQINQLLN